MADVELLVLELYRRAATDVTQGAWTPQAGRGPADDTARHGDESRRRREAMMQLATGNWR